MTIVISKKYVSNIDNNNKVNSTKSVEATQEVSVFDEAKETETKKIKETNFSANDKNPEANFDRQTCLTLKISEAEWNKMSEEEKLKKNSEALKKIVDDYNKGLSGAARRLLKGKVTYASQYLTYAQRCSSPEEMARLTAVVKELDKENQYKAIVTDIEYKSEELKNVADYVIANDYTSYIEENATVAVEKRISKANEENQVIAAKNSTKVDTKYQPETVKAFMAFDNKQVVNTIISQKDLYGIDKKGKINRPAKNACLKEIEVAKAKMNKEKTGKAKTKTEAKTETKAVETKVETKAVETVATETTVAATAAKEEVEVEEEEKEVKEAKKTKNIAKSSIEITEEKIENISKLVEEDKTSELSSSIKDMTEQEKLALLDKNPDLEIINVILNNHPSFLVSCKIQKIIGKMDTKSIDNDIIANLDADTQIEKLQQAASQNRLNTIHRFCLTAKAKRVYDQIA